MTTTISVPAQASEPTAAGGSLWAIVAIGRGEVWRFDPNTGSPKGTVHTGDAPAGLAPAADALWVANRRDGTVSRVDPAGGRVEATVAVGQEPTAVAAGDGLVWVTVQRPGLARPSRRPRNADRSGDDPRADGVEPSQHRLRHVRADPAEPDTAVREVVAVVAARLEAALDEASIAR